MNRVFCKICGLENILKSYASQKTLNVHRRNDHPQHDPLRVKIPRMSLIFVHLESIQSQKLFDVFFPENVCQEAGCSFASVTVDDLLDHLVKIHGLREFEVVKKSFLSSAEFWRWKKHAESSTMSYLVNRWGAQKTAEGAVSRQFCCFLTEKTMSGSPFKCTAFIRVCFVSIVFPYCLNE
jgi:hypothetical protein